MFWTATAPISCLLRLTLAEDVVFHAQKMSKNFNISRLKSDHQGHSEKGKGEKGTKKIQMEVVSTGYSQWLNLNFVKSDSKGCEYNKCNFSWDSCVVLLYTDPHWMFLCCAYIKKEFLWGGEDNRILNCYFVLYCFTFRLHFNVSTKCHIYNVIKADNRTVWTAIAKYALHSV